MTRASDNANLPVTVTYMIGGYGAYPAITLDRSGWAPVVGQTYKVHLASASAPIDYEVTPVNCP